MVALRSSPCPAPISPGICSIPQQVPKPAADMPGPEWRFAGITAMLGVLAGIILWALTTVASRSHVSVSGLSLSGNNALIIPFGLGPAVIAGGWVAIILRMRSHPRWLQLGLLGAVVGIALSGASLLSIVAFGAQGRDVGATASLFFGFLLYGWLLAGAIVAALIPAPDPERRGPPIWSITAILLLPVTMIAGCSAGVGLFHT